MHKKNNRISTLPIQARATTGVGKPQADSEGNEQIPPDGFDLTALEITLDVKIPPALRATSLFKGGFSCGLFPLYEESYPFKIQAPLKGVIPHGVGKCHRR